ncbi:hypothetical protein FOA52_014944 [Chlamydomonas sp. UWO 241]|nr:hypothetical protein FOA52_014944 [Chlamydomonas sp. UWO 241]
MATPRPRGHTGWASKVLLGLGLLTYYCAVLALVRYSLLWTPVPLGADAPATEFSEARAMAHVVHLTKVVGDRQVSTPGLDTATEYMLTQARRLQAMAASRADVTVEVHRETVSGEAGMDFVKINLTNVYRGLDNVALVIRPTASAGSPGSPGPKALLISAHYDSAVCSRGAADDASQVGVMLETARSFLSPGARLPSGPVIFLWTGGEEPLSVAAHGWAASSDLYPTLGAFINLEAMGGGGLPIVFQHTGAWTVEAWARGVRVPRGTRVAQDIFDLNILPADSDYRMFSARHYGTLPGIDVAFIWDSVAYHSYLDEPERIRPGTVQEMGDNLIGAIHAFTEFMAAHPEVVNDQTETMQQTNYFDVLGLTMISYRDSLGHKLHNIPALLSLSLPLLSLRGSGGLAAEYQRLFGGAARAALSLLLAVALPAGLGAVRVALSGVSLVWYSQQWLGHAMFIPIALLGGLLPHLDVEARMTHAVATKRARHGGVFMASQLNGAALTAGAIAAGLSAGGFPGNAFVFCSASLISSALSLILGSAKPSIGVLAAAAAVGVIPVSLGTTVVAVFVRVMMERMGIGGNIHPALGDVIVAVLCGVSVMAATCGGVMVLVAYCLTGFRKRTIAILLLSSLAFAAYGSLYVHPYAVTSPKRVLYCHIHTVGVDEARVADLAAAGVHHGRAVAGSHEAAAGSPAAAAESPKATAESPEAVGEARPARSTLLPHGGLPSVCCGRGPPPGLSVLGSRMALGSMDSNSVEIALRAAGGGFESEARLAMSGRDFSSVYPVSGLMAGVSLAAPPPPLEGPVVTQLPFLCEASPPEARGRGGGDGGCARRMHLQLYTERPAWGIINITGPLSAWSFGTTLMPSLVDEGHRVQHVARFMFQPQRPHLLDFWLETEGGEGCEGGAGGGGAVGLHIETSVSYLDQTADLMAAKARLPDWTSEIWLATVYYARWDF